MGQLHFGSHVLSALSLLLLAAAIFPSTFALIHSTHPDLQSCVDFAIMAGTSLQEDCEKYCFPLTSEMFDYAEMSDDEESLIRNTVCRCFGDDATTGAANGTETEVDFNSNVDVDVDGEGPAKAFECWTEAEVWDLSAPIFPCGDVYNITSLSTCQSFCETIDPKAFSFSGAVGSIHCTCAGVTVCNDNSGAGTSQKKIGLVSVLPILASSIFTMTTLL